MAYERSPTQVNGGVERTPAGAQAGRPATPAVIRSATPTVGSSAAEPGNAVDALNATAAYAIRPHPTHPAAARTLPGIRESRPVASARSAPRPSSHARTNGEKYEPYG